MVYETSPTTRRPRRVHRFDYRPVVLALLAGAVVFVAGCCVGACSVETEKTALTTFAPQETILMETHEPMRAAVVRDDIVTDGNLLAYDLQETMQACCEEYGVPYALALAVADVESRFDPDAVSGTGDYGLMQINEVNHEWLLEQGIDPMTPTGNIEAGVKILAQYLSAYHLTEQALMAYNCGQTGAQQMWESGVHQTAFTKQVMNRYAYWSSVLEG